MSSEEPVAHLVDIEIDEFPIEDYFAKAFKRLFLVDNIRNPDEVLQSAT